MINIFNRKVKMHYWYYKKLQYWYLKKLFIILLLFSRAKDKATQVHEFWKAADFGYMKERRNELKVICQPESEVLTFGKYSGLNFRSL